MVDVRLPSRRELMQQDPKGVDVRRQTVAFTFDLRSHVGDSAAFKRGHFSITENRSAATEVSELHRYHRHVGVYSCRQVTIVRRDVTVDDVLRVQERDSPDEVEAPSNALVERQRTRRHDIEIRVQTSEHRRATKLKKNRTSFPPDDLVQAHEIGVPNGREQLHLRLKIHLNLEDFDCALPAKRFCFVNSSELAKAHQLADCYVWDIDVLRHLVNICSDEECLQRGFRMLTHGGLPFRLRISCFGLAKMLRVKRNFSFAFTTCTASWRGHTIHETEIDDFLVHATNLERHYGRTKGAARAKKS
mmetsp:Transcript_29465/g.80586  ORF Transcript_29465/g.80586 Transcript_29465/m.80586 type:complete len:303 (+) Transcript_29465:586-1494(+)